MKLSFEYLSMKQLTSISLVFLLTSHVLLKTVIVANFLINQSYIATHLCENRNNPASHCHGKCYLKKELKKADEPQSQKQQPFPQKQKENTELQFFTAEISCEKALPEIISKFFLQSEKLLSGCVKKIFHPPG